MNNTDKRYVIYHPETRKFWMFTDKSGVGSFLKLHRNTVRLKLKDGAFEYGGYVVGEPDVVKSKRGSGNINDLKNYGSRGY